MPRQNQSNVLPAALMLGGIALIGWGLTRAAQEVIAPLTDRAEAWASRILAAYPAMMNYGGISYARKLVLIALSADVHPYHLANVIGFESGWTFDPATVNEACVRSGGVKCATGLIQFTDRTARELGTTLAALKRMSAIQQLDYVGAYLDLPRIAEHGFLETQEDVFMAIFQPVAIGDPDYPFNFDAKTQALNSGIYTPRDYTRKALNPANVNLPIDVRLNTTGVEGVAMLPVRPKFLLAQSS